MTSANVKIPGYVAGSWTIDPVHSEVGFTVRHLMVSKVRGKFEAYTATITTGENFTDSHVEAEVDMSSINTGNNVRDDDLRSGNYFDITSHPKMIFKSTGIRADGEDFLLDGDLTIRGVTKPITFKLQVGGFGGDPYGGTRAGFSATAEINRRDFGITTNLALEGGGVMVGDKITISLEIEAVLNK